MKNIKLIKVNQPLYIGELAPDIQRYYKRINIPGMTYESLYTYFVSVVQYGKETSEFWIAQLDGETKAFATWNIVPIPYVGTVECTHIHSWARNRGVVKAFAEEYENFGKRNRCSFFKMTVVNPKVYTIFKDIAEEMGYEIIQDDCIRFIARK